MSNEIIKQLQNKPASTEFVWAIKINVFKMQLVYNCSFPNNNF